MDHSVLQKHLPKVPWLDAAMWRLPGMQPLDPAEWLIRDDAFGGQMALRDRLIAERPADVIAALPRANAAARECLVMVLDALRGDPGFVFEDNVVRRPDGATITVDRNNPLETLGRLQQADICLMEQGPEGHVLTGAVLCFPAQWTLEEKLGRPLVGVHAPVPEYDAKLADRVQRLFDAIRPGQVLWRANAILYRDPYLFTPQREDSQRNRCSPNEASFVRSERQTIRRLPDTGAVAFTIHTYMLALEDLSDPAREVIYRAGLERS